MMFMQVSNEFILVHYCHDPFDIAAADDFSTVCCPDSLIRHRNLCLLRRVNDFRSHHRKELVNIHNRSDIEVFREVGVNIEQFDDSIRVWVDGPLVKTNVKTAPHPGFPTDMQSQIATLLCLAEGTSIITENIWEQRFRYVDELRRMGADITVNGKVALIEGTGKLMGAPVKACDLRAGAALIIAGLAASGVTEIEDIYHIERGYDCMEGKLRALGADIEKVSVPDKAEDSKPDNAKAAV